MWLLQPWNLLHGSSVDTCSSTLFPFNPPIGITGLPDHTMDVGLKTHWYFWEKALKFLDLKARQLHLQHKENKPENSMRHLQGSERCVKQALDLWPPQFIAQKGSNHKTITRGAWPQLWKPHQGVKSWMWSPNLVFEAHHNALRKHCYNSLQGA